MKRRKLVYNKDEKSLFDQIEKEVLISPAVELPNKPTIGHLPPEKRGAGPWRSRLNPFLLDIDRWRKEGKSYRKISELLKSEKGVIASDVMINKFVRARAKIENIPVEIAPELISRMTTPRQDEGRNTPVAPTIYPDPMTANPPPKAEVPRKKLFQLSDPYAEVRTPPRKYPIAKPAV